MIRLTKTWRNRLRVVALAFIAASLPQLAQARGGPVAAVSGGIVVFAALIVALSALTALFAKPGTRLPVFLIGLIAWFLCGVLLNWGGFAALLIPGLLIIFVGAFRTPQPTISPSDEITDNFSKNEPRT